jgi:hypothetical protein
MKRRPKSRNTAVAYMTISDTRNVGCGNFRTVAVTWSDLVHKQLGLPYAMEPHMSTNMHGQLVVELVPVDYVARRATTTMPTYKCSARKAATGTWWTCNISRYEGNHDRDLSLLPDGKQKQVEVYMLVTTGQHLLVTMPPPEPVVPPQPKVDPAPVTVDLPAAAAQETLPLDTARTSNSDPLVKVLNAQRGYLGQMVDQAAERHRNTEEYRAQVMRNINKQTDAMVSIATSLKVLSAAVPPAVAQLAGIVERLKGIAGHHNG